MTFDYDSIPIGYYDQVHAAGRGVQSKWHHHKFAHVQRSMAGLRNHLDIGCGPGTFIGSLPAGRHDSVGIDVAAPQIAYATEKYGSQGRTFQTMQPGILPFDSDRFDVVTLIEVIEHLPNEENERLLGEALRVLKPGGVLLASTPNYGGVYPAVEALVNRLGEIDYRHQHITHYTRSRLTNLITKVGARDAKVRAFMFAAPFFAALSWNCADMVEKLEPDWVRDRFGLLLLARGVKG
ncbi:MAG TPA: methyltransferase domain-containing protein [Magnetospirillaceae bacterium]